jgi:alpha-L-rhamnosidase
LAEIHINGRKVGEDFLTPGWTDYEKRVHYRAWDVTPLLRQGTNALGAILADGWYAGYVGFGAQREHYGRHPRLRLQLNVETGDGPVVVATGPSWKATTGPLREADLLMGETYDARRTLAGWDDPGFDDGQWRKVNVSRAMPCRIQAAPHPAIRCVTEHEPVSVNKTARGTHVFDLGTNFAGFVRLRVKARRGTKVTLRFGERLNPDGTVYTANLRAARARDVYICRGGGRETWEPRFTVHGFQFVEAWGLPGRPGRGAVTGMELSSALPPVGRFHCSDRMANRLFRNICQTQRANFVDIPTDCPQRDERLGWTGDAQMYMRTALYVADGAAFFTKWLVDLVHGQLRDGSFPDVAPRMAALGGGMAAWSEAGVICPWTMYEVYGDMRVLVNHYPSMKRLMAYFRNHSRNHIPPAKTYGFDWLNVDADTPKEVIATAYYGRTAFLMSRIASSLGRKAEARRFTALFKKIKAAFNREYVSASGRIHGDTQTAYVLALGFDLLEGRRRRTALERLVQNIRERDDHLSTGFVGTKDLLPVLTRAGRVDLAYRLFHNKTYPSWGYCIRQGASSIWERWNGWTPEGGFADPRMNSFSHYAFGAVGEWMFRTIGGIETDGPGFKRILIRPRPGGKIRRASVQYDSLRGRIKSVWALREGRFSLSVSIPANTTAKVILPVPATEKVREGNQPASRARGVTVLRGEKDAVVFRVASGSYTFDAPYPPRRK